MAYSNDQGSAVSSSGYLVHTRIRRWIEHPETLRPFLWYGFWPALALLLLALYGLRPFAVNDIQSNVQRETRTALDAAGLGWVQIDVSGQNVHLSGTEPQAGAGDQALALARAATCPSWLGRKICAVAVSGDFAAAAPAAPVAPAAPAPAVAAAAACERSLGDIVASQKIEFASASALISARSAPVIKALADAAAHCEGTIVVDGHTDSVGSADYNRALSQQRAQAVVDALVKQGFPRERLQSEGFGPDQPIGDNATAEGRAKNRRIEFHVRN